MANMGVETNCDGSRAWGQPPTKLSPDNSWGVFLPVYNPMWGKSDYHAILSPQITQESKITWAGPLACFPAETPRNKTVKEDLIKKNGANAFFAVVDNGEDVHIAPLAITIDEKENVPLYPCNGCPKFNRD
jgi:hypothetical protein